MPDAFIILFFVVLFAALITHIVPAGFFEVMMNPDTNKNELVAGSFQFANDYQGVPIFAEHGEVGF